MKLIIYLLLTLVTITVLGQVNQFDFVNFDDNIYVTQNSRVLSGINTGNFQWAFLTTHAEFWHPLTWLSLMLDNNFYGLNAGGYHLTNLVLHIFSTLLLFWLFCRMTKEIWPSAFVAALFAIHPLHVESVAWIAERKDVLSAFFGMLTLCLYVFYTEKPDIKRYIFVLGIYVLALMSKPMVVTLPVIMILLDYWPLSRFRIGVDSQYNKSFLWQLKEKTPFFVLSAIFSVIALLAKYNPTAQDFTLTSRLANLPVSFISYLAKAFWPYDLAVFYPFSKQLPLWQVLGSVLLIVFISAVVIKKARSLPYLFIGWFWYVVTIVPVIGIIQVGKQAMADRFTYLPLVGISVMMAWGVPFLLQGKKIFKKILLTVGIFLIGLWSFLAWKQCGYWKNGMELFNRALDVTKNNYLAHNNLGLALFAKGRTEEAITHYNEALNIKHGGPDHILVYNNRGIAYSRLGLYQKALDDLNTAIGLKPDYADAYSNRGIVYSRLNCHQLALEDFNKAVQLNPDFADLYNNRGVAYAKLGNYQSAIDNFSKAIELNPHYSDALSKRGIVYLEQGNRELGCRDAYKACEMGNCEILKSAQSKGDCR